MAKLETTKAIPDSAVTASPKLFRVAFGSGTNSVSRGHQIRIRACFAPLSNSRFRAARKDLSPKPCNLLQSTIQLTKQQQHRPHRFSALPKHGHMDLPMVGALAEQGADQSTLLGERAKGSGIQLMCRATKVERCLCWSTVVKQKATVHDPGPGT